PRGHPSFPARRSSDLDLGLRFRRVIRSLCRVDGLASPVAVLGAIQFGEAPGRRGAPVERFAERRDFGAEAAFLHLEPLARLECGDRKSTRLNSSHVKI